MRAALPMNDESQSFVFGVGPHDNLFDCGAEDHLLVRELLGTGSGCLIHPFFHF
jgi:hypothetical protein